MAYANRPATLLSIMCEVGATFSRYRTTTNKFKILNKISFKIKIILIVVFTLIYYLYWLFAFKCNSYNPLDPTSNVTTEFHFFYNDFGESVYFKSLNLGSRIIRDLFFGFILIVLNVLTLVFMRQVFIRKRRLKATSSNVLQETTREDKAETKISLMVITTSLVVIVGHIPRFVYSFEVLIGIENTHCISAISNVLFDLSYAVNFFFYLFFLDDFRNYFKNFAFKTIKFLSFNFRK